MKKTIDLRSDTVTRPTPGMLRAMFRARVGDDVFGDDPTVNALQKKVAGMLGKEDGLFLPSGTMANQVAVKCLTEPGDEVVLDSESHIFRYEAAASAVISGVQFYTIDASKGVMTAGQVEKAIRPDDVHQPRTALVCLENTHNRAGGVVYPLSEMERISRLCRQRKIKLYMDGARLWNASVATGIEPRRYAKCCDALMVCFSKGLGCPAGSVLVGSRRFIEKARRVRKMLGGGMRQSGYLAAAGLYALDHHLKRLAEDHKRAKWLAESLSRIPCLDIDLSSVQSNIVIFDISGTGWQADEACARLASRGVWLIPFGRTRIRAVIHLDVDDRDIERAGSEIEKFFRRWGRPPEGKYKTAKK